MSNLHSADFLVTINDGQAEILIGGAGQENVPPGLLGPPVEINKGQLQAYESGGFIGYLAIWANNDPVYFEKTLKNGKTISWGTPY